MTTPLSFLDRDEAEVDHCLTLLRDAERAVDRARMTAQLYRDQALIAAQMSDAVSMLDDVMAAFVEAGAILERAMTEWRGDHDDGNPHYPHTGMGNKL